MNRTYEYHGYALSVTVESDYSWPRKTAARPVGYVAVVRIVQAGTAVAVFSPLRFGESGGRPFATEADALMVGCSAARKIVDDLFNNRIDE
jgi:hypothetical protein